jgi:hypothetical protein
MKQVTEKLGKVISQHFMNGWRVSERYTMLFLRKYVERLDIFMKQLYRIETAKLFSFTENYDSWNSANGDEAGMLFQHTKLCLKAAA